MIAASTLGLLLVGRALGLDPIDVPTDHPRLHAVSLPLTALALVLLVVRLCRRHGESTAEILALGPATHWWAVALVLPAGLLSDRVVQGVQVLFPWVDAGTLTGLSTVATTPGALGWIVGFCIVVVGPLGEEVLFRGYFFKGLLNRQGPVAAILGTSLIFAVFHFNLLQIAGVAILGLQLSWLRQVTGSLFPVLVAHALNNGTWWFTSRFLEGTLEVPMWVDVFAVVILAAGVWTLRSSVGKYPPPPSV